MLKKIALIASMILAASFASAGLTSNLVVNGSFESPNTGTSWGLFDNDKVGGWFAEQNKMEVGAASVYGVTGQTGKQVMEMDSTANAKVSQNVNTLKTSYTFSFDAALRNGTNGTTSQFAVLWNNVVIGTIVPTATKMASYKFTVIGTGKMDKLSFLGTGKSDSYGALVDNVQLVAANNAPVPEPGTCAVVGLGLAAFAKRRRK